MRPIKGKLLTCGLCVLAASLPALAQNSATCTLATLTGSHSLVLSGRNVLSTAALSKFSLSVGTATFDGAGGVTFTLTTNTNQSQGTAQMWSGSYSLPSNCAGTLNITGGNTASFTLIPFNQGKAFTITGQDATYGYTGTGGFPPSACVTATLSGAYTFSGNGYALGSGNITGVNSISGLLQFDGAGAVTGNWSVATSGASTPNSATGHYTMSAACVASATLTDSNGANFALNITVTTADNANFVLVLASAASSFTANGHSTFDYPGLAVEQAAGASLPVPPGSLFSIYGFGLSTGKGQLSKFPLPPTIASASVTVNGEPVPLYSVDNTALGKEGIINAQMPLDIPAGSVATLVVKNGNALSNAVAINIPPAAVPAVFIYGNNHTLAQNFADNFSLNGPAAPANVGDIVVVYLTGGGPVQGQNLLTTGGQTPYPPLFPITANYSAAIAGQPAMVQSIDLVATSVGGFYQANIVVPKVASGERDLVITIGGKASNATLISVK